MSTFPEEEVNVILFKKPIDPKPEPVRIRVVPPYRETLLDETLVSVGVTVNCKASTPAAIFSARPSGC